MEYLELSALYRQDESKYSEEYRRRVSSPDTVTLDFEIHGKPAFLVQTPELYRRAMDILRSEKRIFVLRSRLPAAAMELFSQRCLVDELVYTNGLDGLEDTRREILATLSAMAERTTREKIWRRFTGIATAYTNLRDGADIPIETCRDIRNIYDEALLPEIVDDRPDLAPDGKLFRKGKTPSPENVRRDMRRGVNPERGIIRDVERALAVLRDDNIDILFRIAAFQYFIEYINPFYEGTGRLSRYMLSCLVARHIDPLLAFRLSYTIDENLGEYRRALRACGDTKNLGDITPFVLMLLRLLALAASRLADALEGRLETLERYRTDLGTLAKPGTRTWNAYYLLAQAALFSDRGISTRSLEAHLQVAFGTMQSELTIVSERGLLKKERYGRGIYYMLDLAGTDELIADKKTRKTR